jgi:hypothetical protein
MEQQMRNTVRLFCKEENVIVDNFIIVEAPLPLMHEYSGLFDVWEAG